MSRADWNLRNDMKNAPTRGPTRAISILIVLTFLTMTLGPLATLANVGGGSPQVTSSRAGLGNKIIDPDTWYNTTGTESYANVTVNDGAVLFVRAGTNFNAYSVTLQGGSLIVSGNLNILGMPVAAFPSAIYGYGPFMEINPGGKVILTGPASGTTVDTSQGGNAKIDYLADDHITVKGEIDVNGKDGASPPGPGPWNTGGVGGWVSAGGSADVKLSTRQKMGTKLLVQGATISCYGGKAGSAIDAAGSVSGGYTQGGAVSDHVGAGGYVNISFSGYNVQIIDSTLQAFGGQGGNGGRGGDSTGSTPGGGGGYAGGTSSGGVVAMDYAGSGGAVNMNFFATSTGIISGSAAGRSKILANGGAAGAGGQGGAGGTGSYSPGGTGGGGGGYGGGQGGTGGNYGSGGTAGQSAAVVGYVGTGGMVSASFQAGDNLALIGAASISLSGGHGGSTQGGGFSGSGQSGGGGGGGGYGGGGGGGSDGYSGLEGGSTTIGGRVGDGGDAKIIFDERSVSIGKNVEILATGGLKGDGNTAPGNTASGGGIGGKGIGRGTSNGIARASIPMTAPYVKFPADGATLNSIPTFSWEMVHDAGTSVKGYIIEISSNQSMSGANVIELDPSKSSYKPETMDGGQYFWRMKSKFSEGATDIISTSVRTFYFNKPPNLKRPLPAIRVNEDQNKSNYLNLDDYFTDDLYPNDITYGIVTDQNVHWVTLNLTGARHQMLNVNVTHYFVGTENFEFSATDEGGLVGSSGKVSVVVVPIDHPPRINPVPNQTVTEDSESVLSLNDLGLFDPESWHGMDPVIGQSFYQINTVQVKSDSKYVTFVKDPSASPPNINMVMNFQMPGNFTVNITLSDGILSSVTQMHVDCTPISEPPTILPIPEIDMTQDVPKTIDLKQFSNYEEKPVTLLKWKVRVKDTRLLDFQLDEGNLLRLVSKPMMSGDTTLYLTAIAPDGAMATGTASVKIAAVNYPPKFKDDHLNIPKGVQYTLDLRTVMVDVDSDISTMSIMSISFQNANNSVTQQGLSTAVFNYPDNTRTNDTLLITVENGGATGIYNQTVKLGYAPVFKKKVTSLTFYSDEKLTLDMKKYINDKDQNVSSLTYKFTGYDDTFLQPQAGGGKVIVTAAKAGSGNMTMVVTDSMGFELRQNIKVTVQQPNAMTFLNRNPAVLISLILVIVIVVVLVVLIVTSRKFGKPFKGMKKDQAPAATTVPSPSAVPPPPTGYVEGQGWVQPPGAPPAAPSSGPETAPGASPPPPPPPSPAGPEPVPLPVPKLPTPEPAKPEAVAVADPREREAKRRIRELKRKERHGDMTEKEEEELAHLEAEVEGGAAPVHVPVTKCPKCGEDVEPDFIKCPSCNELLKK